jgi:hypothetical protein
VKGDKEYGDTLVVSGIEDTKLVLDTINQEKTK